MTCSNHEEHSQQSLICASRERILGLKGQGPRCCRFFRELSIEPILIMLRGSGKNSPNPSIHSLKTNGIWNNNGKKKATLTVISSIQFTNLIIYHLQRKHKFHPRLDSPLHLPNEEPVHGYLKFSAKGTKREVFGIPILGSLITADLQGSDPDSPALKPTKNAKKSKPTAPKADPRPPISKPASTKLPEPKPTRLSIKKTQAHQLSERALEESLKSTYDVPRGPLPPVVIREHESVKYQPLPEVPGKGKVNVIKEQVARDLLTLQTPKKKSPAVRYIFQRYTSTHIGSSSHDESSSLYAELGLTDSEEESKKDAGSNPDEQAEGQAGPDPSNAEASQPLTSLVVHAGSDLEHMDLDVADVSTQPSPEQMDEGFTTMAYPKVPENLKLTVKEQVILEEPASSLGTLSSLQHLTKDLSFGDLFFSDKPSEADNDKATAETKDEVMVSITIQQDTSSIPLMTTPIIDLTSRPESPKRIGEFEHIMVNLIQENKRLEQRLDSHGARLYTLEQLNIPHQVSKAVDEVVMDAVDCAMQAPLRNRFRNLPEANMREILHQHMWETDSYKTHEDHMQLYEALEKSMNHDHFEELAKYLAEAFKKKKNSRLSGASRSPRAFRSLQVPPPPPPPPSTNKKASLRNRPGNNFYTTSWRVVPRNYDPKGARFLIASRFPTPPLAYEFFNPRVTEKACSYHGFSELHQLDTFYNALNVNDQDSLNSAAGGNFLDKLPRECLKIIKSKSKVRQSRAKAVVAKVNQALVYQAPILQTQRVSQTDFKSYVKANDEILRNMQSQ
nr:reverse transcriptase domain-containing protein [Tanacetum cinerariifolium]